MPRGTLPCRAVPVNAYVQRDQPPGVPPLRADRRAHAARRAGRELLVPPPSGGVRVDRRAGRRPARARHGLRRGLRLGGAARAPARQRGRSRRQSRGLRARPAALPAPEPDASSAAWSRPSASPARSTRSCSCRRSSTCRTRSPCSRHFARCWRPGGVGLRLDAEPAHARAAPGAEQVGEPVAREGVPGRASSGQLCESVFGRVELLGLFHARKLRVHELALALRLGRGPRPPAAHQAVLRPLHAGDRHQRLRPARGRPRPRRWTSWPCAGPERSGAVAMRRTGPRPIRSDRGELAIVLHTHMPYVEGFGTWPFGEEWLWEAIATSYLPLLDVLGRAPVTAVADPGPVRPAGGARERSSAACGSCARSAPESHRLRHRPSLRRRREAAGRRARALRRRVRGRGRPAASGSGRAACWRRSGRTPPGPRRRPTLCCRCWPRDAGVASRSRPGSPRTGGGSATGPAASGCRSARTRRGSIRCSRRRAYAAPASS